MRVPAGLAGPRSQLSGGGRDDGQDTDGSDDAAYGCCDQALTKFTGHPSNGPGRHPRHRPRPHLSDCVCCGTLAQMPDNEAPSGSDAPTTESPGAPRFEPPSVLAEQERRSQKLLLLVVRLLFLVLLVTVSLLTIGAVLWLFGLILRLVVLFRRREANG